MSANHKVLNSYSNNDNFILLDPFKALDDFGIEKLTIMANEIYDTGKIPQDLSKSILH